MAQQLAYVLITPYTLHKSRTGGIIARLITRTGLELVAARMFAPGAELVQRYSEAVVSAADPQDRLLTQAHARIATIQVIRQTPVAVGIVLNIGIKQQDRH